jgi:hypothetical protein
MKQNSRLRGRRVGTAAALAAVTTCGFVALAPAAFADSSVASLAASKTTHVMIHTDTASQCYQMLGNFGYYVSAARGFACNVAASAPTSEAARVASCVALMKVAGVGIVAATASCTIATSEG